MRRDTTPPWPGRLPDPPPSEVLPEKAPVRLLGPAREPVLVDRRLMMSAAPTVLAPPPGEDGGVPDFEREKCVHCGVCLWNCSQAGPDDPEHGAIRFESGAGGLHSAEN